MVPGCTTRFYKRCRPWRGQVKVVMECTGDPDGDGNRDGMLLGKKESLLVTKQETDREVEIRTNLE